MKHLNIFVIENMTRLISVYLPLPIKLRLKSLSLFLRSIFQRKLWGFTIERDPFDRFVLLFWSALWYLNFFPPTSSKMFGRSVRPLVCHPKLQMPQLLRTSISMHVELTILRTKDNTLTFPSLILKSFPQRSLQRRRSI